MSYIKNHWIIGFLITILSFSGILSIQAAQMKAVPSSDQHIITVTPDKIHWMSGPDSLPKGAMFAILAGDPAKPGIFSMRLKFPAHYAIPAHHHMTAENVTVISGNIYMGHGDKLDKTKSQMYGPGSFISVPAKVNHFAWTDEEVVIQLNNMGPWVIVYVDPKDDPRKQ